MEPQERVHKSTPCDESETRLTATRERGAEDGKGVSGEKRRGDARLHDQTVRIHAFGIGIGVATGVATQRHRATDFGFEDYSQSTSTAIPTPSPMAVQEVASHRRIRSAPGRQP